MKTLRKIHETTIFKALDMGQWSLRFRNKWRGAFGVPQLIARSDHRMLCKEVKLRQSRAESMNWENTVGTKETKAAVVCETKGKREEHHTEWEPQRSTDYSSENTEEYRSAHSRRKLYMAREKPKRGRRNISHYSYRTATNAHPYQWNWKINMSQNSEYSWRSFKNNEE